VDRGQRPDPHGQSGARHRVTEIWTVLTVVRSSAPEQRRQQGRATIREIDPCPITNLQDRILGSDLRDPVAW